MLKALAGGLAALLLLAAPALAAPHFPALTGRVVDEAGILSSATEAQINYKLEQVEATTHHQFVVATIKDLQGYDIEDYGYQLGRAWKIGGEKADDGVVLIVAPSARKVRIEVGYGLEPVLTDALSSVIIQTRIIPSFKAGDMEAGVEAGVDAIAGQLGLPQDQAEAVAEKAQVRQTAPSHRGGGFGWVPIIVIFVLFSVLSGIGRRGRRRHNGLGSAIPWMVLGALANSRSNRDWGGGGGGFGGGGFGGGGGGGFSGGGGSFGGGGASGGW